MSDGGGGFAYVHQMDVGMNVGWSWKAPSEIGNLRKLRVGSSVRVGIIGADGGIGGEIGGEVKKDP